MPSRFMNGCMCALWILFDEMTNLSKDLRKKLSERCVLTHLEIVEKYVSAIDGTAKYLFKLSDDRIIESVLMHYKTRQFSLHFFTGRMQDGMPFLRFHTGRTGASDAGIRDAG